MRYHLGIAAAALALVSGAASAADMPLKAPPLSPFNGGAGWYASIGAEAIVAQANVSGSSLFASSLVSGGLKAAGGAVCGGVGYLNGNASRWWRIDTAGCYDNITGNNGDGSSVVSRWSARQEVDIGFELFGRILAAAGNLGLSSGAFPTFAPALPSNVLVAAGPRQYVGAGIREAGLTGTFGTGAGSTWSIGPMVTTGWLWQGVDANGKLTGGAVDVKLWVSWPMRGATISNVFAGNGQQITFGAGASMATVYGTTLAYHFAL